MRVYLRRLGSTGRRAADRLAVAGWRVRVGVGVTAGVLIFTVGSATAWLAHSAVRIHHLSRGVGDTNFYSEDGRVWFSLDPRREDVPLARISPHLQAAVVAIEDRRFFSHAGIDAWAISRAVVRNVRHRGTVEGGSTISQQLARTLYLSNTRTYTRKAREAILALMLEARLSKQEILELYLNRVYFGHGAYGAQRASRMLFDKDARDLTLAEAALVAGLIRAPSALSPWANPEGAARRGRLVLSVMRGRGLITAEQHGAALRSEPRVYPTPSSASEGSYAHEFLRQRFRESFGGDAPADWQVHTTFSAPLQEAAERAVAVTLREFGIPELQAALVAMNPETGDLLALVGGRGFRESPLNRARSRRQPGSAFKPILYAAALEHGWTPVSVLTGLNALHTAGPEEWSPRNAHDEMSDRLTLRHALSVSNNRAAVSLQQRLGSRAVISQGEALGLSALPDVPSLSLGVAEVSPLELTAAYAAFPNGGFKVEPRAILRVLSDDGTIVDRHDVVRTPALSPETAFQIVSMLEDVVDRGTGRAARALGVAFPAGGKTGTTDGFADAWFVGFSPSLVAGVWVGFDRPAPIAPEGYGGRMALPIWSAFMREAAAMRPPGSFVAPPTLRRAVLCRVSYQRPSAGCPSYTEYFKQADEGPTGLCTIHRQMRRDVERPPVDKFLDRLGRALGSIFRR